MSGFADLCAINLRVLSSWEVRLACYAPTKPRDARHLSTDIPKPPQITADENRREHSERRDDDRRDLDRRNDDRRDAERREPAAGIDWDGIERRLSDRRDDQRRSQGRRQEERRAAERRQIEAIIEQGWPLLDGS